jgi:DNA-directed RNA polymerase beta subunit
MQKQVIREINNGSWRSTEDYENIINMTNIYKIIKSTTIENGITRALSTGDFSIKQSNSSKVGVAQVLNRLTYMSSLSHLRRINTPLEKSGELIAPRKLHNTSFGFLCAVETPEGQSIGVVKNISYMSHITIPTNSASLYEYVEPYILKVEEATSQQLYNQVKVFVNGAWVGITKTPMELYAEMKNKKYCGIINIYTSVVFDYKMAEIRICSDGGRLTRPLLKVKDGKAVITKEIVARLEKGELSWNDLLNACKLDESVIEYIDPEEQNYAMIAMKSKKSYLQDINTKINYTHCEIHPSTIFGVLASCAPYPDHNQAPRNTYQCLDPQELVWMADGSKKAIQDVKIGDEVITFHPTTYALTTTTVVNQFVRPNDYPIYELQTLGGRKIKATEDHKFMTNHGWKTVKEIMTAYNVEFMAYASTQDHCLSETAWHEWKHMRQNLVKIGRYDDSTRSYLFEPLKSFTLMPDGMVADITVESDNHSFLAGEQGFLSSNCAMVKQAIGVYAINYDNRMDKSGYILNYPSRPLVDTRLMNFIQLNRIPSGCQIHVAIASFTGYNQEDSILINKGSIDRGMFSATIYHTEKDEDKNIIRDEIIRCKPDPTKTKCIKFGNYDKLNSAGIH